jgi:hypothetical protein
MPLASTLNGHARGALEKLAGEFDSQRFATVLVCLEGRVPHLTVTSRASAQLTEDIYADGDQFWWSWAEPICFVWETATAAHQICQALAARTPRV